MKQRKNLKKERIIVKNLAYYRLKGDLEAVEAHIADYQLVEPKESGKKWKDLLLTLKAEIQNSLKKKTAEALAEDKQKIENNIQRFEQAYQKDLKFSKATEGLKTYVNKYFKKDEYGLLRLRFAIAFMADNTFEYEYPESSLRPVSELLFDDPEYMGKLYLALWKNFCALGELEQSEDSVAFGFGENIAKLKENVAELLSFFSKKGKKSFSGIIQRRAQKRLKVGAVELSENTLRTVLAAKLTLIEKLGVDVPELERKHLIDECLTEIHTIRADAEYEWLAERLDVPENLQKITLCELCVNRLAEIVGV